MSVQYGAFTANPANPAYRGTPYGFVWSYTQVGSGGYVTLSWDAGWHVRHRIMPGDVILSIGTYPDRATAIEALLATLGDEVRCALLALPEPDVFLNVAKGSDQPPSQG